jgi:hypothetical protein
MTIEATEAAVFVAVQAALPAAITAANAAYSDGVTIPAIATWYRGLIIDVQETDPARLPSVAVGTFSEDPLQAGELAPGIVEVQRPVMVAFVMLGATAQEAHLRTIRVVDVLKRVIRGLAPTLDGVVMYWPQDLKTDYLAPVPYGKADLWVTTGAVLAEQVRVLEDGAS